MVRWDQYIGKKRESTISDWRKLIRDFRDQFPYDAVTALVVETFANSLDAKSTSIDITVGKDTYEIIDDGKGMTRNEMEEYHNIASLTKRKGEGIGFAGVGAKIYLDRADYVFTETKSETFYGATRWFFEGKKLVWIPVKPKGVIRGKTGTYVMVKSKEKVDSLKLTPSFVEDVIRRYYNYVLLGYYGPKTVRVNGKVLKGWYPNEKDIAEIKNFNFKFGNYRIKGFFTKLRNEVPSCFQGISIVVYGKTISQEWFKQYPLESEKFTGMVQADFLSEIVTTSKSDFNRTKTLWRKFHARMGKELLEWLDEINARPRLPSVKLDERSTRELEKSINEILKKPEFRRILDGIFQNIMRRDTYIRSVKGDERGKEVDGMQITAGTLGGDTEAGGVATYGPEEGKGVIKEEDGTERIERVRRRIRSGIHIAYDHQPNVLLEGWIGIDPDTQRQAIVINTGCPSWKIAEGLTLQARAEHVKIYHTLRVIVDVLVREANLDNPEEVAFKIMDEWYKYNL